MKILIVDDEPIVREGLKNNINWDEMNLEVVGSASDGRNALEIFTKSSIDIVLTDIRMPFMDGLELTRKVKEIDPLIIVILLSAYDDFKYAQQAIKLGAFDYILKPIDVDVLKQTVKRAIFKRKELLNKEKEILPSLNEEDLKFFKAEYSKYPLKLEEELSKAIKRGDKDSALNIFNNIWNEFQDKGYTEDFIKRWGLELVAIITRSLIEIGENADILFKETDPWRQISDLSTKEKLREWMENIIEVVCEYVSITKNSKNRKLVEMAIKLIQENYSDLNISLNSIAEKLYITPNYLSALFKGEMGVTFSDYLTAYRIEKAKELLKDVKIKIYEVAEAVGYTDQHYFSKVFKNITGFTPKEYREKVL
ncbi:response regulator transcription factor [Thermoanaerobacter wiegelii]|uniref:Stage 0 sporulation protein A homolog n=1 Tax=Thermoanaerobacter wiegelii Rt8.B1 TaxID=697303 RepID=G2MQS8_9THEO|nr:response regulator [Thermoanaerobacter wiegelii]AEM77977.1 two component transcriptional regulator, AraC family [Thermoanaerobacter wiegelii Rt8.B1]